MNAVEPGGAVTALQFTLINVLNALLFAPVYALIGYLCDVRGQGLGSRAGPGRRILS